MEDACVFAMRRPLNGTVMSDVRTSPLTDRTFHSLVVHSRPNVQLKLSSNYTSLMLMKSSMTNLSNTQETGYKEAIRPRGNLFYMRIYFITNQRLLKRGITGLLYCYFISDFTVYTVTL